MTNPLLTDTLFPKFDQISPEHLRPALEDVLEQGRKAVADIEALTEPASWNNTVAPLEVAQERIGRAWAPAGHLNGVVNTPELQAAYDRCLPLLSDFYTELGQNQILFDRLTALKNGPEYPTLAAAQRKIIDNHLRDFHLSGVSLPSEQKQRYKEIQSRLSELTSKFANNVLQATNRWAFHVTDASALAGIPESGLNLLAQYAAQRDLEGYVITLEFPSYLQIMTYADDRALREKVYRAFSTRASELGDDADTLDNSPLIAEILALRHESAQLLGFDNYAELSIASKMAESTAQVLDFLDELAAKSKDAAARDYAELCAFASANGGPDPLQAWDVTYYSDKLKKARFDISDEELKPYFPLPKVLEGLFTVANKLFGITIQPHDGDVPLWHKDAMLFDIVNPDGTPRGHFYLDPYARSNKRGGAWMDDCTSRFDRPDGISQRPVAFLVCNFPAPVGAQPSLLTHRDVETLFHEFGHGLHHMLTQVPHYSVSGINGVEWDAVELPSQFLENWCWETESLQMFAKHWDSAEVIPSDLIQKLQQSKVFQAGMMMVRQLEFALFDFRLHREYAPGDEQQVQRVLDEVRKEVTVVPPPAFNRFQHSFTHIFAGGYAAGYYSYKWAEVLSADAFEEFSTHGIFDATTGERFRTEILEAGGGRPAMASFVAFKGREPSVDALLSQYGLVA